MISCCKPIVKVCSKALPSFFGFSKAWMMFKPSIKSELRQTGTMCSDPLRSTFSTGIPMD